MVLAYGAQYLTRNVSSKKLVGASRPTFLGPTGGPRTNTLAKKHNAHPDKHRIGFWPADKTCSATPTAG